MIYIVATPIGNLDDITLRARHILSLVDVIVCENPQVTRQLLQLLRIHSKARYIPFLSHHQFNYASIHALLNTYTESMNIACVSDAGMPGVSDPGVLFVRMVQEMRLEYTVLPGPTAVELAVAASGLISKEYTFLGFPPIKGRANWWKKIIESNYPVILYESVHRIEKLLQEAKEYLDPGDKLWIGRELTKKFEHYYLSEVKDIDVTKIPTKGEFTIVISRQKYSLQKTTSSY